MIARNVLTIGTMIRFCVNVVTVLMMDTTLVLTATILRMKGVMRLWQILVAIFFTLFKKEMKVGKTLS
jgi:hypothetical protein